MFSRNFGLFAPCLFVAAMHYKIKVIHSSINFSTISLDLLSGSSAKHALPHSGIPS